MCFAVSCGGRSADRPASEIYFAMLVADLGKEVSESWLDECPCALVLWLLLDPHWGSVRIFLQFWLDAAEWEWRELFNSHNCDVLDPSLDSLVLKVVVDLTRAEEYPLNFRVWD